MLRKIFKNLMVYVLMVIMLTTLLNVDLETIDAATEEVIAVVGGYYNTVILKNDGTVWAWGYNTYGQLGNGTINKAITPIQVSGLSGVTAIAVGTGHTIALKTDGTVWAWGDNSRGQLGNGTTIKATTPVQVSGLSGVKAIVGGGSHTIALKTDGTVWAWGDNYYGQLGDGTTVNKSTPVQVTGLSGVKAIAGGSRHTIALKTDGTVWVWGDNTYGQLGDGTTVNKSTPIKVTGISGVTAVEGGKFHTITLKNDGTVWAWGDNYYGQLGDGTTLNIKTAPVQATGLSGVKAIAGGSNHTIVLKTDGTVWAWGDNSYGQLGDGTAARRSTPVQVTGLSGVTAIDGGNNHTIALKTDGTVWVWGDNSNSQLGDGTATSKSTPNQVVTLSGVTAIDGGGSHSVALKTDGTVWVWGDNYYGQLGDGTAIDKSAPVKVTGVSGVKAIKVGNYFSVALKTDGTVWAWGDNDYGKLGDGTTVDKNTPVQVTGISGVTEIAVGYSHTIALKTDGTVWAWGINRDGQLGNGTTVDKNTPVQVTGLSGVKAIYGGGSNSVALKTDGTVWAWGDNYYGQLGDGTTVDKSTPVQVSGLSGVKAIAVGTGHTIALKTDGTVWAWGYNAFAQLGDGTVVKKTTPVQVSGLSGVLSVEAGYYYSFAIKEGGTVWVWGDNSYGQLGDGTTTRRSTPVQLVGLSGVTTMAGGYQHTVALKSNGVVWAWGDNTNCQLGDGVRVSMSVAPYKSVPCVPYNLSTIPNISTINISWSSFNAAGYDIEINGSSSYVSTSTASYSHGSLAPNTKYIYRIRSKNSGTYKSDWSTAVSKYTLANIPSTGSFGTITNSSILASWNANANPSGTQYALAAYNSSNVLVKQNAWSTSLSDTINGLSPQTQYIIKVKAKNAENVETGWLDIGTATTLPNPPVTIPITGTTVTPSSIKITWNEATGATGYDVFADGVTIYNITINKIIVNNITYIYYEHTGLSASTLHKYQIRAKNAGGVSAWSNELSKYTLPGVPQNIKAAPSNNSIALSWDGISNVTNYQVDKDSVIVSNGTLPSHNHADISSNSIHTYKVNAQNLSGDGGWSSPLTKYTYANVPYSGTIGDITQNSISVSWQANNPAGTQYSIAAFDNGNVLKKQNTWCSTLGDIITGLSANTQYKIMIKAKNNDGIETAWFDIGTISTLPTPPGPPPNLSATSTINSITLTWDEASGATSYVASNGDQVITDIGIDIKTCTFYDLYPDTLYDCYVKSVNSGGESAPTTPSQISTKPLPPDIPTDLKVDLKTTDSIKISWLPSERAGKYFIEVDGAVQLIDNGTSTSYTHSGLLSGTRHTYAVMAENVGGSSGSTPLISSYTKLVQPSGITTTATNTRMTLKYNPVPGATNYFIDINGTLYNTTEKVYVYNGLDPDTQNTYKVQAYNSATESDWSGEYAKRTLPNIPEIPANVNAEAAQYAITITWDEVQGATGYEINTGSNIINTYNNRSYEHTGLIPGMEYTYSVRARNNGGKSAWSSAKSISTQEVAADIPLNLRALSALNDITVQWDPVEGATSYELEIDKTVYESVYEAVYQQQGLDIGSLHTYKVRSDNSGHKSDWSIMLEASTLPNNFEIPQNINAVATDTSITLEWNECINQLSYEVEVNGEGMQTVTEAVYTLSGLESDTQYTYKVRTQNEGGPGDWSMPITVITLPKPLVAPADITAIPEKDKITLVWSPITIATGYEIAEGENITETSDSIYIYNNLLPGTEHTYMVRAKEGTSTSSWSEPVTVFTISNKPSVPTNIKAIRSKDAITINWDIVPGAIAYNFEINDSEQLTVTDAVYSHYDLIPDTEYSYRISAVGNEETGDWSELLRIRTLVETPTVPQNLRSNATDTSITLGWDNVYSATGYEVELDGQIYNAGNTGSYTSGILIPNTQHTIRVRSKNDGGTSPWSQDLAIFTVSPAPGVPANLSVMVEGNAIKLAWDSIAGSDSYEVEADGRLVSNGTNISFVDTGLLSGTMHSYKVRAIIGGITGEWSNQLTKAVPLDIPAVEVNAEGTQISVSWNTVERAVGYDIEVDGVILDNSSNSSYLHSGLVPNTRHAYRVRAKNGITTSEWSVLAEYTTLGLSNIMNCVKDEEINLLVTCDSVASFNTNKFTVLYNYNELELLDLYSITKDADMVLGLINGTQITIIKNEPGIIVFTFGDAVQSGEVRSGIISSIKFKSKIDGQSTVTFSDR